MLGASKRLSLLSNVGRRLYQKGARAERALSGNLLRPSNVELGAGKVGPLLARGKRQTFVTLSGTNYDAVSVEESNHHATNEVASEPGTENSNSENFETEVRPKNTKRAAGRYGERKFKNYSSSEYLNAASLKRDFETILNQDSEITPVTAYQFIRNCGNRMAAETAENRMDLVMEIWDILKGKDVKLETTHFNALLSVYIQNRHKFSPLEFLADMQESKIQPDKSTYMLIVQAYCQEGDLSGALRVVDFMNKQDIPVSEPIYTALVTGHCKNKDMEGAHKVLSTMRENNIDPQVDSYTALMAGYAANGDLEGIDKIFAEMEQNEIAANTLLYMNLLDSFCRNGHFSLIPEGLSRIKHKAPVEMEMRYFIQRLIARGDYESAAILAKHNESWLPSELLNQDELKPHSLFTYRLFRANKPLDEMIRALHVLESHGVTETPLEDVLDICHGQKATENAIKMLDILKENGRKVRSHYLYPMFVQLGDDNDFDGILKLLMYMHENNIKIDVTTFDFASRSFKRAGEDKLESLMDFARDNGLRFSWKMSTEKLDSVLNGDSLQAFIDILPTIHAGMIGTRAKSDRVAEFLVRTFDTQETPKAIIALDQKNLHRLGWVLSKVLEPFNVDHKEGANEAFKIFNALTEAGAVKGLSSYCYTLLLNIFLKNSMKDEFFKVVDAMKEQGIEPNQSQYFIMLKMSSLIGNSAAAQFCFDKLKANQEPTDALYNALLISYGKDNGKGKATDEPNLQYIKKIISLYEEMMERGLKPLALTVSQVLVAYTSLGQIEEANEIRRIHGLGVEHRRYAVYNEYLRLHSKRGNTEKAEELFQEMKDSETENLISMFTYNQVIGTHKMSGNVERVHELIDELTEHGFTPNRVTYSELTKCYIRRGEPEKVLSILESIDRERLPSANVLFNLTAEYFEKSDVESCERGVALIRRKSIDEWGEQRLKHVLLMMYLKVDNISAAREIVDKPDFRLTQRLVMSSLGGMYNDVDFLFKMKNFFRDSNLNYFLADLAILNYYIGSNDVDAALRLYQEKKGGDSMLTDYFLQKLADFLSASGRSVPFDTSVLKKETKARKVEQPAVAPQLQEDAAVEATVSEDTVADTETVRQEKE